MCKVILPSFKNILGPNTPPMNGSMSVHSAKLYLSKKIDTCEGWAGERSRGWIGRALCPWSCWWGVYSCLPSPPHFSVSPGRALVRLGQMNGYRGPDEGESIGSPGEKLK